MTAPKVNTQWVLRNTEEPVYTVSEVLPSAKGVDVILYKSTSSHPVHYGASAFSMDDPFSIFTPYKNPND